MRGMIIASALSIALMFVPFASVVTYPCNLFVTLVHESSHALAALATGGSVESITISPNTSGLTLTRGGSRLITLCAGYTGATLFGAVLLVLLRKEWMRAAAAFGAIFLLVTALRFGGNMLTYATGVVAAAVFLFFFARDRGRLAYYGMSFLAVQCMLNAFYDLRTLVEVSARGGRTISDASMLSQETFGVIPPLVWAIGLCGISLFITYALFRRLVR
jgi:lipid-A-disaccharide synthase-like uncharacterized protein